MPRVVHFEIPADSPERAAKFYQEVFGWQFQKWEGPMEYWMVTTGPEGRPGINGGLLRRNQPGQGTVNTVDVESVDAAVASVEKHGGKVALPKAAIPGVGYLAYGIDPEGNVFGMMQADANAH